MHTIGFAYEAIHVCQHMHLANLADNYGSITWRWMSWMHRPWTYTRSTGCLHRHRRHLPQGNSSLPAAFRYEALPRDQRCSLSRFLAIIPSFSYVIPEGRNVFGIRKMFEQDFVHEGLQMRFFECFRSHGRLECFNS